MKGTNMLPIKTFTAFIFCCFAYNAWANQESKASSEATKDIEAISVVGEYSQAYYRDKMEKAELDFYEAFNALVTIDKYKVNCEAKTRSASRIKSTMCVPKYVTDRMAQETQDARRSGKPLPRKKDIEFMVKDEREASLAYAEKLVLANPALLEKLITMNETQRQHEAAKAKGAK